MTGRYDYSNHNCRNHDLPHSPTGLAVCPSHVYSALGDAGPLGSPLILQKMRIPFFVFESSPHAQGVPGARSDNIYYIYIYPPARIF